MISPVSYPKTKPADANDVELSSAANSDQIPSANTSNPMRANETAEL